MNHLKMFALAVVATMALAVLEVDTSSATTLDTGAGEYLAKESAIDLSLVGGTARLQSTSGSVIDTCTGSTVLGTIAGMGGPSETVKITVSAANTTWSGCNVTTDTTASGELEIHHIAGTSNGTVTGKGFEVTSLTFGTSCTYGLGSSSVDLGTLQGSDTTPAIEIEAIITEQTEDKLLCPNDVLWAASYHVTSPKGLTVTAGPVPTTLEDSNGNHPSAIDASLAGTTILETTGGSVMDTCTGGTIEGNPSTGGPAEAVNAPIAKGGVIWTGCTNTTHTTQGGELEIRHTAGTNNGTVTGTEFEVTVSTFGTSCTYGLSSSGTIAHVGTLNGSDTTATMAINTLVVERTEDKFLCPNDARWTATYHVTSPSGLTVTAG